MNVQSTNDEGVMLTGSIMLRSVLPLCVGLCRIILDLVDFRLVAWSEMGPGGGTPPLHGRQDARRYERSVSLGFVRFRSVARSGECLENASACAMGLLPLTSLLDKPALPVNKHGAIRLFKP
jgi:hypothetical protein